jgi:hypothetical protein
MNTSRRIFSGATIAYVLGCMLLAGCRSLPGPEETTPDGLVRVPARHSGGVFRAPGASFNQYKKLIVEPLTVEFVRDWEANHPEVSAREIRRVRDETAATFREEFQRELFERGGFTLANDTGADVLIVAPAVTELDIPAPESDTVDKRSFAPKSVALRVTGELRDAATGRLIGRVDLFAGGERYGGSELRPANRGTNAFETRAALSQWVRLLRESINVAKTERKDTKLE